MHTVELQEETYQLLQEPFMGEQTFDTTVRMLLEAEYLRRLKRYHYLNQILREKYGMDFEEFHKQKVAQKQGYTWEVEKDAMDWETAIGHIQTLERKLKQLH